MNVGEAAVFVDGLRADVEAAWVDGAWLSWVGLSAALMGARLGLWLLKRRAGR